MSHFHQPAYLIDQHIWILLLHQNYIWLIFYISSCGWYWHCCHWEMSTR